MGFDREAIAQLIEAHGTVLRVVIAGFQGSSPREAGAAMCIWADGAGFGQTGTIGGGALEFEAAKTARKMLDKPTPTAHVERIALGPHLGQCCGGAVTLAFEPLTRQTLAQIPHDGLFVRAVARDASAQMPLPIRRAQKAARGEGVSALRFAQGWLAEPVAPKPRDIWIWGAGHVGRALTQVLAPLPGLRLTWIDTGPNRFPQTLPYGVTPLMLDDPAQLVPNAPRDGAHLIVTYSHALDLELCHRLLRHGFDRCGLIGSASKWARFRSRLAALGHAPGEIARIACPIGDPGLGKHPQAIAISVAAHVLSPPAHALTWEKAL